MNYPFKLSETLKVMGVQLLPDILNKNVIAVLCHKSSRFECTCWTLSSRLICSLFRYRTRCGGGSSLAPVLLYLARGDGAPSVVALGIAR